MAHSNKRETRKVLELLDEMRRLHCPPSRVIFSQVLLLLLLLLLLRFPETALLTDSAANTASHPFLVYSKTVCAFRHSAVEYYTTTCVFVAVVVASF